MTTCVMVQSHASLSPSYYITLHIALITESMRERERRKKSITYTRKLGKVNVRTNKLQYITLQQACIGGREGGRDGEGEGRKGWIEGGKELWDIKNRQCTR